MVDVLIIARKQHFSLLGKVYYKLNLGFYILNIFFLNLGESYITISKKNLGKHSKNKVENH